MSVPVSSMIVRLGHITVASLQSPEVSSKVQESFHVTCFGAILCKIMSMNY